MSVNAPQKIFQATFFNPKDSDFPHFDHLKAYLHKMQDALHYFQLPCLKFVQIFSCLRLKHELGSVMQRLQLKCTIELPGDRGLEWQEPDNLVYMTGRV